MAEYSCYPSSVTVPPCPSGTAPVVIIEASDSDFIRPQASALEALPVPDLLVTGLLLFSFLFGFVAGKK